MSKKHTHHHGHHHGHHHHSHHHHSHHHHGHHHHGHHHHVPNNKKVLWISFILITAFMYLEFIGGYLSNSLALIADAGHMLTDAFSLGLALIAILLGSRRRNKHYTFGYHRAEILAATFNGILLFMIAFYIAYEAMERIFIQPEILSHQMLMIAIIGLTINMIVAFIMWRYGDTEENLNVRAAFLHVLADLLGSVGAIIAALLILLFNWYWVDTIASVIVSCLVLKSAWYVLVSSIRILMEATPIHLSVMTIKRQLHQHHFVKDVQQLRVWNINNEEIVCICQIVVTNLEDYDNKLKQLKQTLKKLGISEMNIQFKLID